ncbi:MAG: hypothetical protein DI586_07920 [Micavibrio aeruginosavorus]|uniref:Uncharacterized protein n=1 Tax=Micavibrio aeruginosavorus TaxID=349221 RepID=A0A2W5FMS4_9BACT|nr:MAG: hypothetical protein DI586_07920 [Micavibrio aeruginosavorus]
MKNKLSGKHKSVASMNRPPLPSDNAAAAHKYYLIQETDRSDTLSKLTMNSAGHTVKVEMPDEDGLLISAYSRWLQLRSELSVSAFQEISEEIFNEKLSSQFSDLQDRKILRFPDGNAPKPKF